MSQEENLKDPFETIRQPISLKRYQLERYQKFAAELGSNLSKMIKILFEEDIREHERSKTPKEARERDERIRVRTEFFENGQENVRIKLQDKSK